MRRLEAVQRHLSEGGGGVSLLPCSGGATGLLYDYWSPSFPAQAQIGQVVLPLVRPAVPELVPFGIVPEQSMALSDAAVLDTLRWMAKKTLLGQDMFLLAPPGPVARWLAFRFCEVAGRECACIAITPDTTESDLKQRREIVNKSLVFVDSAAVTAAKRGWVLVVEGLELAERGVVTVLNNLLENREMHLEDGTFLTSALRYDALSPQDCVKHALVRVDPRFRVIAAGVPTPKFAGNPLDPPLRSRFQYRWVDVAAAPSARLEALARAYPQVDGNTLRGLVSFAASQQTLGGAPVMPHDALSYVARLLQQQPAASVARLLHQTYPHRSMALEDSAVAAIDTGLKWLGLSDDKTEAASASPQLVSFRSDCAVASDGSQVALLGAPSSAVTLPLEAPLFALVSDVSMGRHVLIVGERGWGKTHAARQLVEAVGMSGRSVLVQTYEDLSARDLLQRRSTDGRGDTIWQDSEVVRAAKEGGVVILDGVDQLKPGCIAALQRLLVDGDTELPDGTRLVCPGRWEILQRKSSNAGSLKMVATHPLFRVVAVGQSPGKKKPWLSSHMTSLFKVHVLSALPAAQLEGLLRHSGGSPHLVAALMRFNQRLEQTADAALPPLSLRQLLRLCRKGLSQPGELRDALSVCYLFAFLPVAARTQLEALAAECGFGSDSVPQRAPLEMRATEKSVVIGRAVGAVRVGSNPALVPKVSFVPVQAHLEKLEAMLVDWNAGEHLLLIGNQGVGKNVLADKLLQALNEEREYVQLHRDTTVMSLTLSPSLVGGVIAWEDSPLVRSVALGRTLVIDEVDKAPLEVVVVLKGLLEDGEMMLGDGRRCLRHASALGSERVIAIHPKFRVIALANRPGFPFLGNNFFARVGDCFAAHVVSNVDEQSELAMLRAYGPSVPQFVLTRLVGLFSELRAMVDAGTLQHPYSLRELVQVVKHLQQFPGENLALVLQNVFSLDFNNAIVAPLLREVLLRHGIPVDLVGTARVVRAKWSSLEGRQRMIEWHIIDEGCASVAKESAEVARHRPWKWRPEFVVPLRGRTQARIQRFSELVFAFNLPPKNVVADCVATRDGSVNVLFSSPVQLFTYDAEFRNCGIFDLSVHLPYHRGRLPARPQLFAMTGAGGVELLVVFLPLYRMLVVVDYAGAFATPVQIPALDETSADSSVFNDKMFPDVVSLRGGAKQVLVAASQAGPIAAWAVGGRLICFMDVTSPLWTHAVVSVDAELKRVVAVRDTLWLVQGTDSRSLFLLDESTRVWQRVVCAPSPEVRELLCSAAFGVEQWFCSRQDVAAVSDVAMRQHTCYAHFSDDATVHSLWLRTTGQLAVQTETGRMLLVSAKDRAVKPLCGEEEGDSAVACFCELADGRLMVIRKSGTASVYDTDCDRMKQEESNWRVMAGLPPEDSDEITGNVGEDDEELSLSVKGGEADVTVRSGRGDKGKGEGGKGGAGGGSGPGSGGGEGVGTGGKSGVKREGAGGPRDADGLLDKEIDELQRAMAHKGLEEELALIDMGKMDLQEYRQIVDSVKPEIEQLKNVLLALEARGKERSWLKGRATGELDDTRLVENIVGDANVYKRRGMQQPRAFGPQEKPKRLMFCVDLSASMYRFNTQDQRLGRLQALVVMIMEALSGDELGRKYHYSIAGHSGDDAAISLGVEFGAPPPSAKERYAVVRKMTAHSEYCSSGDNSLEGLKQAIKSVSQQEADDYFVLLVSDANLSRYGVDPLEFGAELTRCAFPGAAGAPAVNAFALFIASFDGEAEAMRRSLPLGKAFVTFDTSELPKVLQQIFASSSFMQSFE